MPLLQASTEPDFAPFGVTSELALPFHIFPFQKMWQRASTWVVA